MTIHRLMIKSNTMLYIICDRSHYYVRDKIKWISILYSNQI